MTWILAFLLSFAHARTSWRALGSEAVPLQQFLRGRSAVALLVGPGAIDLALRFSAHTTDVVTSIDQVQPKKTNVMVQLLRPDTDQDTLLALVDNHSVKLILVVEDPSVRLEWGLRRRARLIEVEPGCARELGTRYHGWYQLDLFN